MRDPAPRSSRSAEAVAVLVAVALHVGLLGTGLLPWAERPLAQADADDAVTTWLELEDVRPAPGGGDMPTEASTPEPPGAPRAPAEAPPSDDPLARNGASEARPAAVVPSPPAPTEPTPTPPPAVEPPAPQLPSDPLDPPPAPPEAPSPVAPPIAPPAAVPVEPPAIAQLPGTPPSETPSAPPEPSSPAAPSPGSPDEYGGAPPPEVALAPGLGGAPVWTLPGVLAPRPEATAAPTSAPAAAPVDPTIAGKVLTSSIQTRDKSLGLQMPAAGVVATSLADAVRSSTAPLDARAKFEVKLGADGSVQGVRVLSATAGDAIEWERAARNAAQALASRTLQVGEAGRDGVTVVVKVESKVVYPAGTKTKADVEPVCAEDVVLEMVRNLEQLGSSEKPTRIQLGDGSFCIPIGLRVRGDVANIGAVQQRVVSSSFDVVLPGSMKLQAEEVLPVDTRAPWLKDLPSKGPRLPPPKKWQKKKKPKKKKDP
ncbi:hypothetical protein [Chondromyces crocatus]|uniref:TonB C-terminal domain-containing protein n=1 Tax=Chondromyces crocatus TaxID=52 RepID=A0A0K1EEC1_CHOCO|nr:hypothetical protein [Chondromyces crocatus]AKT39037.1 uncharacterized protein CMC5_031830 [Chondromyces crocatus]